MKHRDRVLTALQREIPERVPFQATFCPEFAERLKKELGIESKQPYDPHNARWNGYELEKATAQDALQCSIGWTSNYYRDNKPYNDEWGVEWVVDTYETTYGTGLYTNIKRGPLYDEKNINSYKAPDPSKPELYTNLKRLMHEEQSEYYIIGRIHTTIFETAWALRGMDNLMIDFVLDPDKANAVLDFPHKYHQVVAEKMAELNVDMIWLGDDVGAQQSMLISPDMWRTFLKPRMAEIITAVKAIKPDIQIAYHTDGYNLPIIPELIEIGVDVLNPIQAESMNPEQLKKEFGNELSFFGGIDVQTTLPFGKPEDVKAEFKSRLNSLGRHGGWLCAPTHHVQLDTPLENFRAIIDSIQQNTYNGL